MRGGLMALLTNSGKIPVKPLADAVARMQLEQDLSLSEICRNLGWVKDNGKADTTRLQRRLGRMSCMSTHNGKMYRSTQKTIGYDLASRIAKAAGIDPVDVGL